MYFWSYRFIDREFLTITYRTDMEALRRVASEPLGIRKYIVKYEFIGLRIYWFW